MNSRTRPALGLAGALLAAAVVAAACGRGSAGAGTVATPAPTAVATVEASVTAEPSGAASPAPTFDPGTAIDAVDSDLQALGQILGGLDSSLTELDGGAYGGE